MRALVPTRAVMMGALVALVICGCPARTQVVVRVSADPEVLADARYHHVRVVVRGLLDPADAEPRLDEEVTPSGTMRGPGLVPWPFDVVLAPEADDPSRRYQIKVSAEDRGDVAFVTARAISGYVPGETRVLHLRLTASCRDVLCSGPLTCRRGLCETAELAPMELPRLGEPPPDVSVVPDADLALDAGTPDDARVETLDAWRDPAVDAGIDAAPELPDAWVDVDAGPVRFGRVSTTPGMSLVDADDQLGWAVAIDGSGDDYVVGALGAMGTSQLFVYRGGAGPTTLPFTPVIPPFAMSVAVSGDGLRLAVGFPLSGADGSAVHVYRWTGLAWMPEQTIASIFPLDARFGTSVALNGDGSVLAVGAPGRQRPVASGATDFGAVAVFRRTVTTWNLATTLEPPPPPGGSELDGNQELFGHSVALSSDGETLAVGVPGEDTGMGGIGPTPDEAVYDSGAVYVYPRVLSEPTLRTLIKAASPSIGEQLGRSVALDDAGHTLVVGMPLSGAGRAFVFGRASSTDWMPITVLSPASLDSGDAFGHSVAVSGDGRHVAVGAPFDDATPLGLGSNPMDNAVVDSGAVHFFARDDSWAWTFLKYEDAVTGTLGWSVDISSDGRTVIAGAPSFPTSSRGAFCVFD